MSHEPKPSEHAYAAAYQLGGGTIEAEIIDLHAIAPAVAERDRRIKELEAALEKCGEHFNELDDLAWAQDSDFGPRSYREVAEHTRAVLAKSERSAP